MLTGKNRGVHPGDSHNLHVSKKAARAERSITKANAETELKSSKATRVMQGVKCGCGQMPTAMSEKRAVYNHKKNFLNREYNAV